MVGRILVVDDEALVLEVTRRLLEAEGHEVRATVNPREAVAMARSWRPDLIVLDHGMPEYDGPRVARYVRTFDRLVRIVLYTGNLDLPRRELVRTLDLATVVQKAAGPDPLFIAVDAALNHAQVLRHLDEQRQVAEQALAASRRRLQQLERTEHELRSARLQAEAANDSKTRFVAHMSHELRTPLNAIIGYGELIAEQAFHDDDEGLAGDVGRILSSGRHLLALVDSVLDLAAIEAGKLEVLEEQVELFPLLEDVAATARPLMEKNGNRLDLELPARLPAALGDSMRIRQVLLNLLSNAAKFTRDGRIRLAVRSDDREPHAAQAVFEISDTGIGISEEQLRALFRPFHQADTSTRREYGGSGLGLSLCRRFARLMHGDVTLESTLGRGTTARFVLPAVAQRALATA